MSNSETKKGLPRGVWIAVILIVIAAAALWYFTGASPAGEPQATAVPTEAPTAEPTDAPTPEPTQVTAPVQTEFDDAASSLDVQVAEAIAAEQPHLVTTDAFELTYSGPMAELIRTNPIEDTEEEDMAFTVTIGEHEYLLFTLCLNSSEGDYVTVLTDPSGGKIPVAFIIEPAPVTLSGEDLLTFGNAQETINEIVSSLVLK